MVLVVADQAPVQYQDPVGLLDPPPLRLRHEPYVLRVAFDDLHVDPERGGAGNTGIVMTAAAAAAIVTVTAAVLPSCSRSPLRPACERSRQLEPLHAA